MYCFDKRSIKYVNQSLHKEYLKTFRSLSMLVDVFLFEIFIWQVPILHSIITRTKVDPKNNSWLCVYNYTSITKHIITILFEANSCYG